MAVGRYETALSLADQAAIECGLSASGGLFASTDANFILIRNLLNTCGRELAYMHPWRQLTKSASITLAAAAGSDVHGVNTLPTDFSHAHNDTFWDTTDEEQLIGPLTDQQWEYATITDSNVFPPAFKFEGNAVWVYPPNAGDTLSFKYQSRLWVKPSAQSSPTLSAATADTDVVYFEPLLFTRLLKLRYFQARGRDTTSVAVDFETVYNSAVQSDRPGRVLTIGRRFWGRFVDASNVPDTGFGS